METLLLLSQVLLDNRKRELYDEGYDLKAINQKLEEEKRKADG
jgi:hypothetical protein